MGALARASATSAGTIDWNFLIGDPAFDVGRTFTLNMDIGPNISDDHNLETALQYNEQYREAYQSVRPINDKAVAACRASQCTSFLLHCLSDKKDIIATSPSMRRSLTHTIENITDLKIAFPDS